MDAVIDLRGRFHHAQAEARSRSFQERLRSAARAVISARGELRHSDPLAALTLWQGLVAGRWSLMDRIESDGRRFIVACRNAPQAERHARLSRRETQVATLAGLGHPDKVIAYELGVSLSTASTLLRRVVRKLGVSGRSELVELFSHTLP